MAWFPKALENQSDIMQFLSKEFDRFTERTKTNWRYALYSYRLYRVEYVDGNVAKFVFPQGIDPKEWLKAIQLNSVDYPLGGCPAVKRVAGPFKTHDDVFNFKFQGE